jgi:hypothetical protein
MTISVLFPVVLNYLLKLEEQERTPDDVHVLDVSKANAPLDLERGRAAWAAVSTCATRQAMRDASCQSRTLVR